MDFFDFHLLDSVASFDLSSFDFHSITLLAQNFDDVDIIADMEEAWGNFVETGQCWALLIGVVVGYGFKGLTSY